MTVTSDSSTPGAPVKLDADFQLPAESATVPNATIGRAVAILPPQVSPYNAVFGTSANQCAASKIRPGNTATVGFQYFDKNFGTVCPPDALIGTATITSPLVPDPIIGKIYFINKSPIPNIGIWIDPTIAPTNPKGVTVGLVGKTATIANPDDNSFTSLVLTLDSIPDLPVSRLQLAIGDNAARPLGQRVLINAASDDPSCLPNTLYGDSRAPFQAITRMRPWTKITSDAQMAAWGTPPDSLLTLTAADTELRNGGLGIGPCD
jgi:hypothetical protein